MGVTYKLRDEVVNFIISQRQGHPLYSCRQLAESASLKFGLHLSKSSVHDVLRESGIMTPRGRKPKDKFKIPQEKKKQIQVSLSQVNVDLLPPKKEVESPNPVIQVPNEIEISPEYEGAGNIFIKAALWDLGIYSEENVKETDWDYYLTYAKGIKVNLENDKSFFIEMPIPLERCIKEAVDSLVNNIEPLRVDKVSDQDLFKSAMSAQEGYKIANFSIVDQKDHDLVKLEDIVDGSIDFIISDRFFVEIKEKSIQERARLIFFSSIPNDNVNLNNIINLKGFDSKSSDEISVTICIDESYEHLTVLQNAANNLNSMFLRDDENRLLSVKIDLVKK